MSTAREMVDQLGWAETEPRSQYDLTVFRCLQALVSETERLEDEIRQLREDTAAALVEGGTLA